ncbi:MAG TPA: aminoacyl-tRNA hydrolase [Candidatus Portnoybacteria bacterium]|nr:aminoacyl-tRNA hydrolase [Candidatus Portnoybacteria bacterium]
MKLIIGLGNPGSEYFNTRHNFGFLVLNYLQDSLPDFSSWQTDNKFKALLSEGQINGEKILLAKPQTFMNNSGQAAKLLADFYKTPAADIIVLHDDLDIVLGEIRLSQNSSAGGHKGVASVIQELGTQDFTRLRLGIKPASQNFFAKIFKTPAEKFVLRKFGAEEKEPVQQATQQAKETILSILQNGLSAAQNQFN